MNTFAKIEMKVLFGLLLLGSPAMAQKKQIVGTKTDDTYGNMTVVYKDKKATATDEEILAQLDKSYGMGDVIQIDFAPEKPAVVEKKAVKSPVSLTAPAAKPVLVSTTTTTAAAKSAPDSEKQIKVTQAHNVVAKSPENAPVKAAQPLKPKMTVAPGVVENKKPETLATTTAQAATAPAAKKTEPAITKTASTNKVAVAATPKTAPINKVAVAAAPKNADVKSKTIVAPANRQAEVANVAAVSEKKTAVEKAESAPKKVRSEKSVKSSKSKSHKKAKTMKLKNRKSGKQKYGCFKF